MTDGDSGCAATDLFAAEMTRYQRNLFAFLLTILPYPAEAEDVLQETNLVLWRKLSDYDPALPFLPWAMQFAKLQAMAHCKKRRRWRLLDEGLLVEVAEELFAESGLAEERQRALAGCLQKLAPDQRLLVSRRYAPGGCINDMAAERGCSPKALSETLRRIRKKLQQCIEATIAAGSSSG